MTGRSRKPRPMSDLVQELMRAWGMDRAVREQRVFAVWSEALGEPLARNTRPVAVHQGHLIVAVKDSAWMQELQFMKEGMKKKLNRVLGSGVIKQVKFKIGSWEQGRSKEENSCDEVELDPAVIQEAQEAAAAIPDQLLREQVFKALIASAKKAALERGDE